MVKSSILSLLLIALSAHSAVTNNYDANLDPGPLSWWVESWTASPIEVSRSNEASTNVTLTFKFRPKQSLDSGCIEVHFPSDITPPTDSYNNANENKYQACSQTITANKDTSFAVPGVTLPNSNHAYGPFMIVTRNYPYGQIRDINKSFGSIYVTQKVATTSLLTVTASTNAEIYTTTTLFFKFNIDVDIWKFDTFVITVDSKWTVATAPVCTSVDLGQGTTNFFKSTDGTHVLDCVSHSSDPASPSTELIYVYGLSENLDVSELGGSNSQLELKLSVTGFTAPVADWTSNNYSWKIEMWRWGTRNALKKYEGTGPETTPSSLTVNSWVPHSTYSAAEILEELTLYTDITFTTTHNIPAGGTVELTFTDVVVSTTAWKKSPDTLTATATGYCYVKWFGTTYTCTVTSEKFKIKFNAAIPESTQIVVTALSRFDASSPKVQVTSYYSDEISPIDQSAQFAISYASTGVRTAFSFYLYFQTTAGVIDDDTDEEMDLLQVVATLNANAYASNIYGQLTIHIPINNSGVAEKSFFISNASGTTNGPFAVSVSPFAITTTDPSNAGDIDGTGRVVASSDATNMTISTPACIDLGSSKTGATFAFENFNTSNVKMTRPTVASNLETRYEAWMTFQRYTDVACTAANGNDKIVGFQVLTFSELDYNTPTIARDCGNLISFSFRPQFTITATDTTTKQYYLDFYSTDVPSMDSGLAAGSAYPYATGSGSQFTTPTLTLVNENNVDILRLSGQSTYDSGSANPYLLYTAIASSASSANYILTNYYVDTANDPNIKYVLSKTTQAVAAALSNTASQYKTTYDLSIAQNSVNVEMAIHAIDFTAAKVHSVQFPRGVSLASASFAVYDASATSDVAYDNIIKITSTDAKFKYPVIIGTSNASIGALDNTADNLKVTGVTASSFSLNTTTQSQLGIFGERATCFDTSSGQFKVNYGTITVSSYTPVTTKGRGPDSYNETVTVNFTAANIILAGSKIQIVIDPSWIVKGSCTTTGLTAVTAITCNETTTGTFEISGFEQVSAAAPITVTFSNVIPPINNGSTDLLRGHIDSITTSITYDNQNWIIDQKLISDNNSCTVTPQTQPGTSIISSAQTFPPNALQTSVDLYLRFKLTNQLPANGMISIQNPTGAWSVSTSLTKNYVFMSIPYTSVAINGGKLEIVVQSDVSASDIELRVDGAFINPSQNSAGYFKIKTTYEGIVFDEDTDISSIITTHQLSVQPSVKGSINNNSNTVKLSVKNANELSTYTINFSANIQILETDSIWVKFPRDYDPYLWSAEASFKWSASSTYYIECASEELGEEIFCIVDHWYLKVVNIDEVEANTNVSITVKNVRNPAQGTTGTFDIFIFDSNNSAKAVRRNIPGVSISALAENISIKQIVPASYKLFNSGDYQFEFYQTGMIASDHQLIVKLPKQYNTNLTRGEDAIACSLFKIDHTSTTTSEQAVISSSTCTASDNYITLDIPLGTNLDQTSSIRGIFKVENLQNPQWGYTRSSSSKFEWNFDANDSDVFTIYDSWTDQVQLFVFNQETNQYTSRSYLDVNAAYLGFDFNYRGFLVNDYDPKTTNGRINIIPGTQSANLIIRTKGGSGSPCSAKSVRFTPSVISSKENDDDLFRFTSKTSNFTMRYSKSQILFRVGASVNTPTGLYYIDWNIDEERQDSLKTNQYDPPAKTLVEVAGVSKIGFQVPALEQINPGTTSQPYAITLTNPPHTSVFVDISVATNTDKVKIKPESLEYVFDQDTRYFVVSVDEDYTLGESNTITLRLKLRGTDASAYTISETLSFEIVSTDLISAGTVTQLTHTEPARTSVQLSATSDVTGIFYYYVTPVGGQTMTGEELVDLVGDYFNLDGLKKETDELFLGEEPNSSDLAHSRLEPWVAMQRRQYIEFLQNIWYGAAVSSQGNTIVIANLDSLFAETNYITYCYVANRNGELSDVVTDSWTTAAMPNATRFSLVFNGDISDNYEEALARAAATSIGISPYRFTKFNRTITRRLQEANTTTFTWTIAPQMNLSEDDVSMDQEQIALLNQAIAELGISSTPTINSSTISRADISAPQWVATPAQAEVESDSVSATMQCSAVGEICGICSTTAQDGLNHNQLLIGVDASNAEVPNNCLDYNDISQIAVLKISGLQPSTSYTCYYMCYASYPVVGIPMTYSSENPIKSVTASTKSLTEEEDDDLANYLKVVLSLILVLVFQL